MVRISVSYTANMSSSLILTKLQMIIQILSYIIEWEVIISNIVSQIISKPDAKQQLIILKFVMLIILLIYSMPQFLQTQAIKNIVITKIQTIIIAFIWSFICIFVIEYTTYNIQQLPITDNDSLLMLQQNCNVIYLYKLIIGFFISAMVYYILYNIYAVIQLNTRIMLSITWAIILYYYTIQIIDYISVLQNLIEKITNLYEDVTYNFSYVTIPIEFFIINILYVSIVIYIINIIVKIIKTKLQRWNNNRNLRRLKINTNRAK